jgi:hypothetical protein
VPPQSLQLRQSEDVNAAGLIPSMARFGGFRHLAMEVKIGAALLVVISNHRFLSRKGDGLVCVTGVVPSFRPRKVPLRSPVFPSRRISLLLSLSAGTNQATSSKEEEPALCVKEPV